MYGLPRNFDGQFFIGRVLEQICFTQNQVALHFDGLVALTIESAFSYRETPSSAEELVEELPPRQSTLMRLLGESVSGVDGSQDGTLSLRFTNRHELRCFDTASNYESYRIRYGENEIVV